MKAILVCDLHGDGYYELFRIETADSITYECPVCRAEEIIADYTGKNFPKES